VQFLTFIAMGIDVFTLAREYPDVVIQVKVTDLIEAAHIFAKDLASINELKTKEKLLPDTLFTKKRGDGVVRHQRNHFVEMGCKIQLPASGYGWCRTPVEVEGYISNY